MILGQIFTMRSAMISYLTHCCFFLIDIPLKPPTHQIMEYSGIIEPHTKFMAHSGGMPLRMLRHMINIFIMISCQYLFSLFQHKENTDVFSKSLIKSVSGCVQLYSESCIIPSPISVQSS